jgi:hypothetical protein
MEAMVIAVITPITIPRTVRKLRNLCARTLSNAITSVSRNTLFGSLSFIPGPCLLLALPKFNSLVSSVLEPGNARL